MFMVKSAKVKPPPDIDAIQYMGSLHIVRVGVSYTRRSPTYNGRRRMPRNSVTFDGRVQHAQYIFALMASKCKGKLFLSNSSAGETQSKDRSPELSSLKGNK